MMELDADEYERGAKDAAGDIEAGHPKLYWQTRGRWGEYLTQLMAERFAVAIVHTNDITNAAKMSYQSGCNRTVESFIDCRFGEDSYRAAIEEVERFRRRDYDEYFKQRGSVE